MSWVPAILTSRITSLLLILMVVGLGLGYASTSSSQSSQINQLNSEIANLNSENANLNNEIAVLQANSNGQSNTNSALLNLQESTVEATNVNVNAHCIALIVSFQANYAGYLLVTNSGYVTSGTTAYLDALVHYSTPDTGSYAPSYSGYYEVSSPNVIPVSPGSVMLYLSSVGTAGTCPSGSQAAGTFSVTYYY